MADEHAGLHKDLVTGELVSKTYVRSRILSPLISIDFISELKRRQKQRAKESIKAEKAPAANANEEKVNEDDLNPNVSHVRCFNHVIFLKPCY